MRLPIVLLVTGTVALAACSATKSAAPPGHGLASSAPPTLMAAASPKVGQPLLVDSAGRTVYLFVPDGTSQVSTVPAAFKANWAPVTAMGMPTVAGGLDPTMLGLSTQPDGTHQVTYNGHLLYTFIKDTAPGQANGQDIGDNWYALSPSGDAIH